MNTATLTAAPAHRDTAPSQPDPEQQARADSYRLIGTLLARAPSADLLALLRALQVPDLDGDQDQATTGRDAIGPAWASLRTAAVETTTEALERDYWRLFIGLGRGELVPYASWYQTGYLMEEPLAQLRSELARLGFSRQQHSGEPEDHATALCEVMSELITAHSTFTQQQHFFSNFIQPWMGRFFDDLAAIDDAPFHAAVGHLGATFIAIEQRYFDMNI